MRYRVTLETEQVSRRPDHGSSIPRWFTKKFWQTESVVEGDASVAVAALRALLAGLEEKK